MFGIVALSKNNVIGFRNKIPWRYPEDMKFFKNQTTGNIVIMGRNTWESMGSKPLPNRLNIILSTTISNPNNINNPNNIDKTNSCIWCKSKREVLDIIDQCNSEEKRDVYVIGGNQIYELFSDQITRWYITHIPEEIMAHRELIYFNTSLLYNFRKPEWVPTQTIWLSDDVCVEKLERIK